MLQLVVVLDVSPLVLFSVGKKKGIEEALLKNAAGGGGLRKRGRTRSAAPGCGIYKDQTHLLWVVVVPNE